MFTKGCYMTQGILENMNKNSGILCVCTFKKTVHLIEYNFQPQNVYP